MKTSSAARRVSTAQAMFEVINTPMRGAALGMGLTAVLVLVLSLSDGLLRLIDRTADQSARDARRQRFRGYAVLLLCGSIGMVIASNLLAWGTT